MSARELLLFKGIQLFRCSHGSSLYVSWAGLNVRKMKTKKEKFNGIKPLFSSNHYRTRGLAIFVSV